MIGVLLVLFGQVPQAPSVPEQEPNDTREAAAQDSRAMSHWPVMPKSRILPCWPNRD